MSAPPRCDEAESPDAHPRYELLEHLPPYGPPALLFSPSGPGPYSEQLIIRFWDRWGQDWVGNFRRDRGIGDEVISFKNPGRLLVIAKGNIYLVDIDTRACLLAENAQVQERFEIPAVDYVVLRENRAFGAYGSDGRIWSTPDPLGFFREIKTTGVVMSGLSKDDWENEVRFELNLETGSLVVQEVWRTNAAAQATKPSVPRINGREAT